MTRRQQIIHHLMGGHGWPMKTAQELVRCFAGVNDTNWSMQSSRSIAQVIDRAARDAGFYPPVKHVRRPRI